MSVRPTAHRGDARMEPLDDLLRRRPRRTGCALLGTPVLAGRRRSALHRRAPRSPSSHRCAATRWMHRSTVRPAPRLEPGDTAVVHGPSLSSSPPTPTAFDEAIRPGRHLLRRHRSCAPYDETTGGTVLLAGASQRPRRTCPTPPARTPAAWSSYRPTTTASPCATTSKNASPPAPRPPRRARPPDRLAAGLRPARLVRAQLPTLVPRSRRRDRRPGPPGPAPLPRSPLDPGLPRRASPTSPVRRWPAASPTSPARAPLGYLTDLG